MGFLIVLLSFIFLVSPLIMNAGVWAGYAPNSWQLCVFRVIGLAVLIHFFSRPYPSAVSFIADIIFYSLFLFVIQKFWPLSPNLPPK